MSVFRSLSPRLRPWAERLLEAARASYPTIAVTSARRTRTEQARLYNDYLAGRSRLPALPPGQSIHERGLAFDLARPDVDPRDDDALREVGALWRKMGGIYGGDSDPVHFEAPASWTARYKKRRSRPRPASSSLARELLYGTTIPNVSYALGGVLNPFARVYRLGRSMLKLPVDRSDLDDWTPSS